MTACPPNTPCDICFNTDDLVLPVNDQIAIVNCCLACIVDTEVDDILTHDA
jgi:hypothetical protein